MSDEQRQYEAIRSVVLEKQKIDFVAKRFGCKTSILKTFLQTFYKKFINRG